ncbi:MAG: radical SAM protein [Thermodesulfobacteriota bacterium]
MDQGAARVDLARIVDAVGSVPRVAYEDVHVYPLSALDFSPAPGLTRPAAGAGPVKLYVHVPFCNYACTFCFYAKRVGTPRREMERYVRAVLGELDALPQGGVLGQLYVGGGTPTALPADLLDELLAGVFDRLARAPRASLTVESSPESLTEAHARVLQARGVPRVSMGAETLDPAVLATIRRGHGARQALDACSLLVESGFYVNVDLIYGPPGQSEASFRADLEALTGRRPNSVTLYNLRLNEKTPLARVVDEIDRLDVARLVRWRAFVREVAVELGYVQTRWHTWVRRHDPEVAYDRAPCVDGYGAGRQLGVGMSAVSHLGDTVYRNEERFAAYLARIEDGASPVAGVFALRPEDHRTLYVARTLGDGAPLARGDYATTFGRPIEHDFGDVLERLLGADLVADRDGALVLTPAGRLVYDLVLLSFYPASARRWLAERARLGPRRPRALAATPAS